MKRTRLARRTELQRGAGPKRGPSIPKVGVRGKRLAKEGTLHGPLCEYVKTLPCPICGRRPVDPHHVRSKGAGWLDRLPDGSGNVTPLCVEHHTGSEGVHTLGRETFAARFGVDLASVARTIGRETK